jgi:hypothetical protein
MKNIFVYYLTIIVPLILLYFIGKYSAVTFVFGLFIYIFIYRIIIDGLRLTSKKIITKKEIWKLGLTFGGYISKYFKELYFQP